MSREPNFEPRGIRFERTVTAGNLLTVFGGLIAMTAAYADYKVTLERHDMRISASESSIQLLQAQIAETNKSHLETARAIDRLTFQLQLKEQQQK